MCRKCFTTWVDRICKPLNFVRLSWKDLNSEEQLEQIKKDSQQVPQVIFKHSVRCSISGLVKNRLFKGELPDDHSGFYYLDLIRHRSLSNQIAEDFGVRHESPQILVIKDGKCVYNASHHAIHLDELLENTRQFSVN